MTAYAGERVLSARQQPDVFIATTDALKYSVAPVSCLRLNAGGQIQSRANVGTAVFLSADGDFLTPAHVLDSEPETCPAMAVYIPRLEWTDSPNQDIRWYQFDPQFCVSDHQLDLSRCRTSDSPADEGFDVRPAVFAAARPPDGMAVAFTGFALGAIRPVTARGFIAGYHLGGQFASGAELVIDRTACKAPPVFLDTD